MNPFIGLKPLTATTTFDATNTPIEVGNFVMYPSIYDKDPQLATGIVIQLLPRHLMVVPLGTLDDKLQIERQARPGSRNERYCTHARVRPSAAINVTHTIPQNDIDVYTLAVQTDMDFSNPEDRPGCAYRYTVETYHVKDSSDVWVVISEIPGSTQDDLSESRWYSAEVNQLQYRGRGGIRFRSGGFSWDGSPSNNGYRSWYDRIADILLSKKKLNDLGLTPYINTVMSLNDFRNIIEQTNPILASAIGK